jgi:hypothetical protein
MLRGGGEGSRVLAELGRSQLEGLHKIFLSPEHTCATPTRVVLGVLPVAMYTCNILPSPRDLMRIVRTLAAGIGNVCTW